MSVYSITNRYATALLKQAEDKNQFDEVSEDVQVVYDTLLASRELRVALESPVINESKKKDVLNEIFGSKVNPETAKFLNFVVSKNREDVLFEIVKRFLELRDDKKNIVSAVVTTAVELSADDKDLFKKSLENYTKKNIRISFKVDPSLIGGFLVQLKDKMLNASVLQQLNLLKKRLVKADQTLVN